MALGSWIVFEKLDRYVNRNSIIIRLSQCTIDKCAEAAKLITCFMDEATAEETEPMPILEFERDELESDRSVTVIELQDALDVANRQQQENDNGNRPGLRPNCRNCRNCRAPERYRNDGDDNEDDDEQEMNIEHLRLKLKEMDEALTGIDEAISAHAERIKVITSEMDGRIGPAKTKEEFVEYARVKVKSIQAEMIMLQI